MFLVFPWSYHDFLLEFRQSLRNLRLPRLVPYQMRHSGPAIDLARGYRTRAEVKHTGRWSSESSVNRYAQRARLGVYFAKLPATVQSFLTAAERNVENIACGRMSPTELSLLQIPE